MKFRKAKLGEEKKKINIKDLNSPFAAQEYLQHLISKYILFCI